VMGRTVALTPEDVARAAAPLITPLPPPAGPGLISTPPLSDGERELIDAPPRTPVDPMPPFEVPGRPMEPTRLDDLIIESRGLGTAGSIEHKAAAWDDYQARDGEWAYDRWSTAYDLNQTRAREANAATDAYHSTLGWGRREVTIDNLVVDGVPTSRRLDIADSLGRSGIEYKTGYQTATSDNLWELKRDAELVGRGWNIEWVFRDSASKPLLDALDEAGIKHKVGP